ncbi:hypothetical protein QWY82_05095 [Simiduia curdlanivorans]|uniref:Uncharacterized protein n=1 Tax=Simiduia curdlanivorans TaxID=1492769 RepID=A0ABV8V3T6_9GAMM|nr:hypothetical protein [Simiduia curdlanivorans]MDN3638185.1 hypothetical protein [Simiduia curdlanivorans]
MYKIVFNGVVIGASLLEAGDPPVGRVSGIIKHIKNTDEFSFFILQCGGTESSEEYRLELNSHFLVVSADDSTIPYAGGYILWYPELDEAIIELVGIPYPEYGELFPEHVAKYKKQL